jgi:tRNA(Ile)-lysidine synthase TilS/MesJ
LGEKASEAQARQARYDFLHQVREATGARAILTAHHADDVLETAVHNILRGTGRRGLSSLQNTVHIVRPLTGRTKAELRNYAVLNQLKWREDPSNQDPRYARNYLRHHVLPRLSKAERERLHRHIQKAHELNLAIDALLANYLHTQPSLQILNRRSFIELPHAVAREVMAAWLRNNHVTFDRKLLEQLVIAAKTMRIGKFMSLDKVHSLSITKDELALVRRDRQDAV